MFLEQFDCTSHHKCPDMIKVMHKTGSMIPHQAANYAVNFAAFTG
jgi:hypothetical protein